MSTAKQYPAHVGIKSVLEMSSFSKSHVYACIRKSGFPAPKKLGGRSIWESSAVQKWIDENLHDAEVSK